MWYLIPVVMVGMWYYYATNSVEIVGQRALIKVRGELMTLPYQSLCGRVKVMASVDATNLPIIVKHSAGITYVIGLPHTPTQYGYSRLTLTIDRDGRLTSKTFYGNDAIILKTVLECQPLLEAGD